MSKDAQAKQQPAHVYNPWSPDWDKPAIEAVVNDDTKWYQLCDKTVALTNAEFKALWADEDTPQCKKCFDIMKAEDPNGFIYEY